MRMPKLFGAPSNCSSFVVAVSHTLGWAAGSGRVVHQLIAAILPALFLFTSTREQIYNVLWVLVFGFATLNILTLGARRFEQKSGLNFGEVLAVLIVVVSVVLLGWEMLYVFEILPIRLGPH